MWLRQLLPGPHFPCTENLLEEILEKMLACMAFNTSIWTLSSVAITAVLGWWLCPELQWQWGWKHPCSWGSWRTLHSLMTPNQRPMSWRLDCFIVWRLFQKSSWDLSHGASVSKFTLQGSCCALVGVQGTTVFSYFQLVLPTYELTLSSERVCLIQVGRQPNTS